MEFLALGLDFPSETEICEHPKQDDVEHEADNVDVHFALFHRHLVEQFVRVAVVAVERVAVEGFASTPVNGQHHPLEPVAQVAQVRARHHVARDVAQRHAKTGEHHQRHRYHGANERSVLKIITIRL